MHLLLVVAQLSASCSQLLPHVLCLLCLFSEMVLCFVIELCHRATVRHTLPSVSTHRDTWQATTSQAHTTAAFSTLIQHATQGAHHCRRA
jgi:hypothetical protein